MARYIDADKFKEHIASFTGLFTEEGFMIDYQAVLTAIDNASAAEVVPKSEVACMVLDDYLKEINLLFPQHCSMRINNTIETINSFDLGRERALFAAIKAVEKIRKKYLQKECPTCQPFVGCEQANWTGPCDDYKEEKQ